GGDWHYRARLTLVVEGRRAGYHRARSHRLLEIEDCPIADPALSAHLGAARSWISALRVPLRRVSLAVAPGGVVLAAVTNAPRGAACGSTASSAIPSRLRRGATTPRVSGSTT